MKDTRQMLDNFAQDGIGHRMGVIQVLLRLRKQKDGSRGDAVSAARCGLAASWRLRERKSVPAENLMVAEVRSLWIRCHSAADGVLTGVNTPIRHWN